jgi:hypothetical protein
MALVNTVTELGVSLKAGNEQMGKMRNTDTYKIIARTRLG